MRPGHEVIPGQVTYLKDFIPEDRRAALMDAIRESAPWSQERLMTPAGPVNFPRLVAWHGEPGVTYRYSGIDHPAAEWTDPLHEIRDLIWSTLGWRPTGVLLNRYRDGNDSIGRHADVETDLVPGAPIFGVSLGATREIVFRSKVPRQRDAEPWKNPRYEFVKQDLADGSLLIMYGGCQDDWTHEIRKVKDREVGERISLTFRMVRM